VALAADAGLDEWRAAARPLLAAGLPPERILWSEGEDDLFRPDPPPAPEGRAPAVPRAFFDLAGTVVLHRDRQRFALLYRLAWRAAREPGLLSVATDPLVAAVEGMAKAVRRDIHKMHAFVRFHGIRDADGERFVAWFEPDHHIVAAAAPFFRDRFAALRWSILTPDRSVAWDGVELMFGPAWNARGPARRRRGGPLAALLRGDLQSGTAETEGDGGRDAAALLAQPAGGAVDRTPHRRSAVPHARDAGYARRPAQPRPQRREADAPTPLPTDGLPALRAALGGCRRCRLWQPATQPVFGEGPLDADLVLVGEQPGDLEDLAGRPFVGPAGQVLDAALAEAGIDRARVYVTNAVKHFKFEPRGKRRIHQRPDGGEIAACRWWLDQELGLLRPRLVVALGATAVQALLGRALPIGRNRGRPMPREGAAGADHRPPVIHPADSRRSRPRT
jgi:DNA polymerase